jgi:hypothetical protein
MSMLRSDDRNRPTSPRRGKTRSRAAVAAVALAVGAGSLVALAGGHSSTVWLHATELWRAVAAPDANEAFGRIETTATNASTSGSAVPRTTPTIDAAGQGGTGGSFEANNAVSIGFADSATESATHAVSIGFADEATDSAVHGISVGFANAAIAVASHAATVGFTSGTADVAASNVTIDHSSTGPGGTLSVNFTVANTGSTPVPGTLTYVTLAPSPTAPPGSHTVLTLLPTPPLGTGTSVPLALRVVIPAGTNAGTFYVCARADGSSLLAQQNTANDLACSTAVTVVGGARLDFSVIPSPQEAMVGFPVTVTARDEGGAVIASVSGPVTVSSGAGTIGQLTLRAGIAAASLKVPRAGHGVTLTAIGMGLSGASNSFDVTGTGTGTITGVVRDAQGSVVSGARVELAIPGGQTGDGRAADPPFAITAPDGTYTITTSWCGTGATIAASEGSRVSRSRRADIVCNSVSSAQLQFDDGPCDDSTIGNLTPIILLPGILGSSTGLRPIIPTLPSENIKMGGDQWADSTSYGLHDPLGLVGWEDLIAAIKGYVSDPPESRYTIGCTLIPLAYDWRHDLDGTAAELGEKIEEVGRRTNKAGVYVVAHSMGGLVARAYIQSPAYQSAATKIEKLLMVGTPNHGAWTPYYLWFGGDPVEADNQNRPGFFDVPGQAFQVVAPYFYASTFQQLYFSSLQVDLLRLVRSVGPGPILREPILPSRGRMRRFIRERAPSVKQLLRVDETAFSFSSEEKNNWLGNLNTQFEAEPWRYNGVELSVFRGTSKPTITGLVLNGPSATYPLGVPVDPAQRDTVGDGTVLEVSAPLPGVSPHDSEGSHSGLIKIFKSCILERLGLGATCGAQSPEMRAPAADETNVQRLELRVRGGGGVMLTAPDGKRAGLDVAAGALTEIPQSAAVTDGENASIQLAALVDGTYGVAFSAEAAADLAIDLEYVDSRGMFARHVLRRVEAGQTTQFGLVIASQSEEPLAIQDAPAAPAGAKSVVAAGMPRMASLQWDAVSDPGIAGFRIYVKGAEEPLFNLAATLPSSQTGFDTGDRWVDDEAIPVRYYAITAIDQQGHESFYSNVLANDDRDDDGVPDLEEVALGTNPDQADTESDGFSDLEEQDAGTDPLRADSDGDGWTDREEARGGSDPLNAASNTGPTPAVAAISPTHGRGGPITVTISGGGFYPISKAWWNGAERPSTLVSASELRIQLTGADLAAPGTGMIRVYNSPPGGGLSNEVPFTIDGIAATLTWPQPAPIPVGTALSVAQLNAAANVPGTFVYAPDVGTVLPLGVHTLSVTFTPTDMVNYTTATASVTLHVVPLSVSKPAPYDFTGDHHSDVLWRHVSQGALYLWPMSGNVPQPESYVGQVGTEWQIRSIADFTGDGTADLLWRQTTTGTIYLWPMQGGVPQPEEYVATIPPAYEIVAAGDFDHDGKADLLWRHVTQGDMWLWRMNGSEQLGEEYVDTVPPAYVVRGVGDLDGNGTADLVWQHTSGGDVWVWLMTGPAHQVEYVATVWDPGYQVKAVGDVTGDGKADILWHHVTQGAVYLWTMNGAQREAETWVTTVWDVNYQVAAAGDYDGDSKMDPIWRHVTNGDAWLWKMNGAIKESETWIGTVPPAYHLVR